VTGDGILEGGFVEGIEQEQQEGQDEEGGEQTLGLIHFDWVVFLASGCCWLQGIIVIR